VSDCESAISKILCRESHKIKVVPIEDIASTFDFDGTVEDEKLIEKAIMKIY
jgi:hypothetical protein